MSLHAAHLGGCAKRSESRASAAALAVAALLLAVGLPAPRARAPACNSPRETASLGGHSTRIACSEPGRGGRPLRGPARRLFGLPIDPNRADALTLEVLSGIGPARAAALVKARAERPFESVEALLRVPGIGPVTLERVRSALAVESAGATPGRAARAPVEIERGVD